MNNQIVVGFDGSPSSTEAVHWASFEAAARHHRLRIVSCYGIPMTAAAGAMWLSGAVISSIEEESTTAIETMRADVVASHPDLIVDIDVCFGPPRESLLTDVGVGDIVVVGASGHEGAAGFWLGSTSRWVTRHSPCPVVVVRGAASRGRPDRIVVGTDGSAASDAAVLWAADEADLHGVDLVVVHAWDYPYLGLDTRTEQVRDLTRVDAALVLDRSAELARERCGVTVKDVLVEDTATTALLDTVRDGDLLVLGAEGRGAIAAGLLGSTVNSVVERSAVPVVVVH